MRYKVSGSQQNYSKNYGSFTKKDEKGLPHGQALAACSGQERSQEHEQDNDDILEYEYGKYGLAMGRIDLSPLLVEPEDNGRTAQGHEETYKDGAICRKPKAKNKNNGCGNDCKGNLERTAYKDLAFQAEQFLEGKLKADGEQQKDDPDLGQQFHLMHALYQVQAMGAYQGAGQQETDDGWQLNPVTYLENDNGQPENDGNIL